MTHVTNYDVDMVRGTGLARAKKRLMLLPVIKAERDGLSVNPRPSSALCWAHEKTNEVPSPRGFLEKCRRTAHLFPHTPLPCKFLGVSKDSPLLKV